jgi:hypothetical protein
MSARGSSGQPHMTGSYAARLQVSGRSTYVGTFSIAEWLSDSLRGSLRLVSPLAVDMVIGGRHAHDTLRLNGTYSAANGCTGTFAAPLVVTTDLATATGPFTLVDKCAGTLTGQMELKR